MITLEECKKILGADCVLTDSEVESLRSDLYSLAEIATSCFINQKGMRNEEK